MQAHEALLDYVRCNVAPAMHTGSALLAALRNTRLLPTGCERRGLVKPHCQQVQGCTRPALTLAVMHQLLLLLTDL